MSFDPTLSPPGIAVSSTGPNRSIPTHLQSAFEDAVCLDEQGALLPLLSIVGKMRSPHIDCVIAWSDELRLIVARNRQLEPFWPDLFQFFLCRHRIAVDSAVEHKS